MAKIILSSTDIISSITDVVENIKNVFSSIYAIIQPFLFNDGFSFIQIVLGAWAIIVLIQIGKSFIGG